MKNDLAKSKVKILKIFGIVKGGKKTLTVLYLFSFALIIYAFIENLLSLRIINFETIIFVLGGYAGACCIGIGMGWESAQSHFKEYPFFGEEQNAEDLFKFFDTGELTENLAGVLEHSDQVRALFVK